MDVQGVIGTGRHRQRVLRMDQQIQVQGLAPINLRVMDVGQGLLTPSPHKRRIARALCCMQCMRCSAQCSTRTHDWIGMTLLP